ncbi:hypothetical protein [Streptomyces monashensis]|uniref:Leucine-binding protein domain-containing protein n=1 Tax=Streptomyces monashensis TaxID=1678012 RepID=A0A1S2PTA9_9ACTN|nr:hypothetical protein [Streptomyces monashensis]OIJ97051.1 hypothetical protein BIV23_31645 [Streptomyces monashensis]
MTTSPLVPAAAAAAYGGLPAPSAHTKPELDALIVLLTRAGFRIESVAVGHARYAESRAAAAAFSTAWQARGGQVLATLDWPETSASWLRPARRLTAQRPDAWVVVGALS